MEKTIEVISNLKIKSTHLLCDEEHNIMKYQGSCLIPELKWYEFWKPQKRMNRYVCPTCGTEKLTEMYYPIYKIIIFENEIPKEEQMNEREDKGTN